MEALEKVQKTLSQDKIKHLQRTNAYDSVSWAINQIRVLNENPNRDLERQAEQPSTGDIARLANIEKELAEIKKAITEPRKTYAQAAQMGTTSATERTRIEIAKRKHIENIRKEHAKTTVTLSLHTASEDLRETFEPTTEDRMVETVQKHVSERLHIPLTPIRTTSVKTSNFLNCWG